MQIIRQRSVEYFTTYSRSFSLVSDPGRGYTFECDAQGNVNEALHPAGLANWQACLAGVNEKGEAIRDDGVQERECRGVSERIGKCECGCEVYLSHFTNTCDGCQRDYNMSGQELAPREQWGEETGEQYSDFCDV